MTIEAGWENPNPEVRFVPGQQFLKLFVLGNEVLVVFCNLLLRGLGLSPKQNMRPDWQRMTPPTHVQALPRMAGPYQKRLANLTGLGEGGGWASQ